MAEPYNFLNGSQEDINRRLLRKIEELESSAYDDTALKARIKAVEDEIGDENTADTILKRIEELESSAYDDTALKASIKAVEDEIGDENTADTILKRIKDLETAAQDSETTES